MFPENSEKEPAGTANESTRERILEAATKQIFEHGYHSFKMDLLAELLGMSKKTIYIHFRSKEAVLDAVVKRLQDGLAKRLDEILANDSIEFPERLSSVIEAVFMTIRQIRPGVFEDFERYAPKVFRRMDEVRKQLIPQVFGQLLKEGMERGYIRPDIDPQFTTLAWLQIVRGMTLPEILESTGLSPSQTVRMAYDLFWPGILTDTGREALANTSVGEAT